MKNLIILTFLLGYIGCTHFEPMNHDELKKHQIIGLWKMSIEPYFYKISCDGYLSFLRPSSILYADQSGTGYAITELQEDGIITGPIFRSKFNVSTWPTERNGRIIMEIDGRTLYLENKFECN